MIKYLVALFVGGILLTNPPKIIVKSLPKREMRDTTTNFIVLHYDDGTSAQNTYRYLRKSGKSYHYYIDRDGTIHKWLDPKYKSSSAGQSQWQDFIGMNEYSISICFQNNPPQKYTSIQYKSGAYLIRSLYYRFPDLKPRPILGHSDVARDRKLDPGDHFSWEQLFTELDTYD